MRLGEGSWYRVMIDVWWVGDRQENNGEWLWIAVVVECELWKDEERLT